MDPAPARALHGNIVSRFRTLNGQAQQDIDTKNDGNARSFDLIADEEGKTIEDLLAEIGPEDSWNVPKNEADQVDELLRHAHNVLAKGREDKAQDESVIDKDNPNATSDADASRGHGLRFDDARQEPTVEEIDHDADEYLAQILDELKHAPQQPPTDDQRNVNGAAAESSASTTVMSMPMPEAPDKDLEPPSYSDATADDELASRFANLGLPSIPKGAPAATTKAPPKAQVKGYTDEEIDSWCVICNENATLVCPGCDGDLYCTNCWLDGHKGPDAGYEERTHRAKHYVRGGAEKQASKRLLGI